MKTWENYMGDDVCRGAVDGLGLDLDDREDIEAQVEATVAAMCAACDWKGLSEMTGDDVGWLADCIEDEVKAHVPQEQVFTEVEKILDELGRLDEYRKWQEREEQREQERQERERAWREQHPGEEPDINFCIPDEEIPW